jgi:hypothetical protein
MAHSTGATVTTAATHQAAARAAQWLAVIRTHI